MRLVFFVCTSLFLISLLSIFSSNAFAACNKVKLIQNGIVTFVCQEQLQAQSQSINFNPEINNNSTNNNNNNNTNNNNINITNNNGGGYVYPVVAVYRLPGTGPSSLFWIGLLSFFPIGIFLKRLSF